MAHVITHLGNIRYTIIKQEALYWRRKEKQGGLSERNNKGVYVNTSFWVGAVRSFPIFEVIVCLKR